MTDEVGDLISASEAAMCDADWDKVFTTGKTMMRREEGGFLGDKRFTDWIHTNRKEIIAAASRYQWRRDHRGR